MVMTGSREHSQSLRETREARLEAHCEDLLQTLLLSHRQKDVYLSCKDNLALPLHKFILGVQCKCVPTARAQQSVCIPSVAAAGTAATVNSQVI